MGDPIKQLHAAMVKERLLTGDEAVFENFQAGMSDPGSRREVYDYLKTAKPDMVDVDFGQFDKMFAPAPAPAGSKKKAQGVGDGFGASSSAPAPTAAPLSDPFGRDGSEPSIQPADTSTQPPAGQPRANVASSTDPFQRVQEGPEVLPVDAQAIPFQLNGSEDPLEVGGKYRRLIEKDYDAMDARANKYAWRKGERDLEKISLYGQEAVKQVNAASQLMSRRLGPDWQKEFAKYSEIVGPMLDGTYKPENAADAAYMQEAMEFYAEIKAEPSFQLWADGQQALAKAQASFNEYGKRNPEYAKQLAEQRALQMQADEQPGFAFQNWTGRKATQIVAGIASLPRTMFGIPQSPGLRTDVLAKTPLYDYAQAMGDWADNAVEWATRVSPTGSGSERGLWENIATFEGVDVVLDDKGVMQGAFKDNKAVEVDNAFVQRFSKSGAAQTAETKFTGMGNTAFKLVDVVADLYLMRTMGGGTMAGTTAAAFSLQHQDAYNTALRDLKLTGEDAETYAMVSAGLSALVEASIGKIEMAPLKLQMAKSLGLKEARMLVGKASAYDIAKAAWRPLLIESGKEGGEELVDMVGQVLNNQVFNVLTGATLDTKITPEKTAETFLMAVVATGSVGGSDAVRTGKSQLHTLGLNMAVQNPPAYDKLLGILKDEGVLNEQDVAIQQARIQHLAEVDRTLPKSLTEEQRREVIDLQDMRFSVAGMEANAPAAAQKEAAKKTLKSLDTKIAGILTKPAEKVEDIVAEQEEAPVVEGEQPVAIAAEKPVEIVESEPTVPVAVAPDQPTDVAGDPMLEIFDGGRSVVDDTTPFDAPPATTDRLGENRLVPVEERGDAPVLTDLLPTRNTTVAEVAANYQNPDHGDAFLDDLTNLAVNSLQPAQAKALGDGIVPLRDFLSDHFQDEAWVGSVAGQPFQRTVENLTAEYVRENTSTVPTPDQRLGERLEAVTVQDHIAKLFVGGKVKVKMTDIQGDVAGIRGDGGQRLQYTSRNGVPIDMLAQDIMEAMGQDGDTLGSQDVINEIKDFIHSNPSGPGDYLRKTVAERERIASGMDEEMAQIGYSSAEVRDASEKAVQVMAELTPAEEKEWGDFLELYTDGNMLSEKLLDDWEAWDPFENPDSPISKLSTNVYNAVNKLLNEPARYNSESDQNDGVRAETPAKESPVQVNAGTDGTAAATAADPAPAVSQAEGQRVVEQARYASMPGQIEESLAEVDAMLATMELPEDLTAELAHEMRVDGVIDQVQHEAVLNYLGGSEASSDKAAYEDAVSKMEALRQTVSEGPGLQERSPMDGPEILPSPTVTIMADGQALVEYGAGFADLLSNLGGRYDAALRGWVFPADQLAAVNEVLSQRRTDGSPIQAVLERGKTETGMLGPVLNLLTSPGAILKAYRTKTRLSAAKNLDERLAVAMQAHRIDRKKDAVVVARTLKRLQRAFPNIVIVTDVRAVDDAKAALGLTGSVLGFEYQGQVYVDPRVARPTTPIHEFGHIWNTWLKAHDPKMYGRGAELARQSDLFGQIQNNPAYAGKTDDQIVDEVLATSIGERGALIGDTGAVLRFRGFLQRLWSAAERAFGINPRFATLREFSDHQAMRMLGGRPLMRETSARIAELNNDLEGIRAQYGGEKGAKGAVLDNLDVAWEMEEQGMDDEKIFHATGWYRGVDGMWRWVIDSGAMKLRVDPATFNSYETPLSQVIDYPALFAAYPNIAQASFILDQTLPTGFAAAEEDVQVSMSSATLAQPGVKSLLVHEIQHLIQRTEGFSPGTSPQKIPTILAMEDISIGQDFLSDPEDMSERDFAVLRRRMDRVDRYKKDVRGNMLAYLRAAGEVEARAAMTMNRPNVFPPSLYDVAPEDQIVLLEDGYDMAPPRLQVDMGAADYVARAATARDIIEAEIRDNGIRTLNATALRLSEAMNLDLTHVRQIYESEIARAGMGKVVLTPNEIGMAPETTAQKLRRQFGIRAQETGQTLRRKFSTTKGLPKPIFNADEDRLGMVAKRLKDGEYLLADLEDAMQTTYGKDLSPAHWQHVDNVIRGQGDWSTLPANIGPIGRVRTVVNKVFADPNRVSVRVAAERIRRFTDSLTRDLVRSGVMDGEVVLTVLNNSGSNITQLEMLNYGGVNLYDAIGKLPFERTDMENAAIEDMLAKQSNKFGNYLYRSYRKHDDPKWATEVPPRIKAEARRELERQINQRIAELQEARTDKVEVLEEQIGQHQADINAILDGIEAKMQELKDRKTDLGDKRRAAVANSKSTAGIDRSYAAADKALRNLAKRAREARSVALDDASDLLELEGAEYQALSVAAKRIIKIREQIGVLNERIEAVGEFRQSELDQMYHNLQNVDVIMDKILAEEKSPAGQLTQSKLGAKDLKILKKRKDIAEPIRELMGEYHDPRVNFAKSMYRMVNLLENQIFLTRLREQFAGEYFIPPNELRKGFEAISSEGSEVMAPLNGWQTTTEIHNVLKNYFQRTIQGTTLDSQIYRAYVKSVAGVKYGKTILSPVTHLRNFVGNIFFMANNAYNPFQAKTMLAFRDAFTNRLAQDERAYVLELTEARILNNGSYIGSIRDLLSTMNADTAKEFFRNRFGTGLNKARRVIEDAYGAEDDFYRIMAYENEKKRYARRLYGSKFENLTSAEQTAVRAKAAEIVLNTLPTYSRVPEIVRDIQRFPLTGTFVAFPAEMFRVTWNQYRLIHSDMKDPRTRSLGVQRLIGTSIAQIGLTLGLQTLGRFLTGIDWEEDKMARQFMLPWQQDGVLMYKSFKPGEEFSFVNTSYTDPYKFMKEPVMYFLRNDKKPIEERLSGAAWQVIEPFFSAELTANTLGQLIYNTNERTGKRIYSERMGMFTEETYDFLKWSLQPGIMKTYGDLKSAATGEAIGGRSPKVMSDVLMGFFGAQVERVRLDKAVPSVLYRKNKEKAEVRSNFTLKQDDLKNDRPKLSARYDSVAKEYNEVLKEVRQAVEAAEGLGLGKQKVQYLLKEGGFSTAERAAILSGRPLMPKFDEFNRNAKE